VVLAEVVLVPSVESEDSEGVGLRSSVVDDLVPVTRLLAVGYVELNV